jgi:hypothetical protein
LGHCEPRRGEAISHLLPEIASLACVALQRRLLAKTFGKVILKSLCLIHYSTHGRAFTFHFTGKKYNPIYNLPPMQPGRKTAKLEARGNMANTNYESNLCTTADAKFYEISVKGQLDESWSDWLEGLEVKCLDNGEMILLGTIGDQAALMGILITLNRLNLTLLSLREVNPKKNNVNP